MINEIDNIKELEKKLRIGRSILPSFIINSIRNTKFIFKNIKKWYRVIIDDRDWDFVFLIDVIEVKLKSMIKSTEKYGDLESSDNSVKEMKSFLSALVKLRDLHCSDFKSYEEYEKYKSKLFDDINESFRSIENWWY